MPQAPAPGASSLPLMPPGQQPGPANVQTAAAPAPAPPMGAPMAGPPPWIAGNFPPGTMTGTAPSPQAALAMMRALDRGGQKAAIGVQPPPSGWRPSPAAPPALGGPAPAPAQGGADASGIPSPPGMGPPGAGDQGDGGMIPARIINPMEEAGKLVKQGMTPEEAGKTALAMLPVWEQMNKSAITQFTEQSRIAREVIAFRNAKLREAREKRVAEQAEAREGRLERREDRLEQPKDTAGRRGAGAPPIGLTPEGVELAARQYLKDGRMPSLGFDSGSKRAILDRAGQIEKEEGGEFGQVPGARAEFHANSLALNNITKDLTAIRPFADMLDTNAGILKTLAAKVAKTDTRYANKTLNWLGQNVTGDADVAEFLAQMRFVQTEAARVLNNPRLVGQLTDTARHEMEGVVDGTLSLDQTNRVIDRILQDSKNRIGAMEKQRTGLAKTLRGEGGKSPDSSPGAAAAAPKVVDWSDLK